MPRSLIDRITPLVWALLLGSTAVPAAGQAELADYFGFDDLEVVKIGRGAGPFLLADLNGDDLLDLVVVNNWASRVELHYQKADASPDDVVPTSRVNEFPEHWRFRRENLTVAHHVSALVAHDFDGDGLTDLIYSGVPPAMVFVRQSAPGVFEVTRRHRVPKLQANRDALLVRDVVGDERPELLSIVGGDISIWTLDGDRLEQPLRLLAGDVVAITVADFNADGRPDVAGVIPDDAAPVRLWFGTGSGAARTMSPQHRFEMPGLREFDAVDLLGHEAALLAVIERASKRIVLYEVNEETLESSGDREAAFTVTSFLDGSSRSRGVAVADVDGDGMPDLVATDTRSNAIVVHPQRAGKGPGPGESHPSLSELAGIVAANVDDDPYAELFVFSEEEGVVGRSDAGPDGIPFPSPLGISEGYTPVAMNLVHLEDGVHVAVVAKESRDHVVDLIDMSGARRTIELGALSRSPETIQALDADQDGRTDLLVFTRDKPMTMLHAGEEGFTLTESKDMGQYGFVKAARSDNIAVHDIDGDDKPELLVADNNFVRAVRYVSEPAAGVSPGWQVAAQINAEDDSTELVSLAVLGDRIIAGDRENSRLVILGRDGEGAAGSAGWVEQESLRVSGFDFTTIFAGPFCGNDDPGVLAIGTDGFALIRLVGARVVLDKVAAWRTPEERRLQHELTSGDLNGDGYTDLISLDAGEQMCEIFSFSQTRKLHYAMGFQVFESKIFSGGESLEYEPRMAAVGDLTGDGADDLVLLSHDRILLYPQMKAEN